MKESRKTEVLPAVGSFRNFLDYFAVFFRLFLLNVGSTCSLNLR